MVSTLVSPPQGEEIKQPIQLCSAYIFEILCKINLNFRSHKSFLFY